MKIIQQPDGKIRVKIGCPGCLLLLAAIVAALAVILGLGVRLFSWVAG